MCLDHRQIQKIAACAELIGIRPSHSSEQSIEEMLLCNLRVKDEHKARRHVVSLSGYVVVISRHLGLPEEKIGPQDLRDFAYAHNALMGELTKVIGSKGVNYPVIKIYARPTRRDRESGSPGVIAFRTR